MPASQGKIAVDLVGRIDFSTRWFPVYVVDERLEEVLTKEALETIVRECKGLYFSRASRIRTSPTNMREIVTEVIEPWIDKLNHDLVELGIQVCVSLDWRYRTCLSCRPVYSLVFFASQVIASCAAHDVKL
mmetsp:Transcript_7354/g.11747  ORF Transcript_7354/g.11747 Transcript_7354/m.11747 type:complete len:131 (-) Transcript_7354:465-857(-)